MASSRLTDQDVMRVNGVPVDDVAALDIAALVERQRRYFQSGATRPHRFRRQRLEALRELVRSNERRIHAALADDLAKPNFEAYVSETGVVLAEVGHAIDRLEDWMEPERVSTPLTLFPSSSSIRYEPMGVALIIAPWNYPLQLVLAPLVGALAAGNCAVVKPSEWAVATSELVAELLPSYFETELVSSVTGGVDAAKALLEERFDHIFFTGSAPVGKIVARAAAEHLTPVTLELGGKSPAIVDDEVSMNAAARRIAWGKFFNAGQTCLAPDYVLVPKVLEEELVTRLRDHLRRFFGDDPRKSADYARIINRRHFDRLAELLAEGRVVHGGETDADELFIEPTILAELPESARSLQEEIFGPVLPVVPYETFDDAISFAKRHPDPLALYFFSKSRDRRERVLDEVPFGGGAINDVLIHFSNPELPFGGRGPSGVGSYHGRFGFETFSHRKAVVESSTLIDPPIRYPPYSGKLRWLKMLLR